MGSIQQQKGANGCLRLGLALLASGLLLTADGCGRRGDSAPGVVEVTIWSGWTGPEEIGFRRLLRRYEQLHPNIRFHNLSGVNDDTKTLRALVAGVPPDVFGLWDYAYLGPFARNHAIRPLDGLFRQSGLREADFLPASLGMARYQGRLYAMPFLVVIAALYWNKQAFAEAGLDPDRPPRTLEELTEYAVKLTKRDASGKITRLGLLPPGDAASFHVVLKLFGGSLVDPATGRITTDAPANITAARWYKDLIDRMGGIGQVKAFRSGFGQEQSANNPFFVGKVAMMFSGEWNTYWLSRYAPQVEYGIAPIPPPASHPENVERVSFGADNFCIPAESKHPKEAWDFLVWLQSYEAQVMFARAINNIPNMRAAIRAPELRFGAAYRKRFATLMDLAARAKPAYFPVLPVTSLYLNQMSTALDRIAYNERTPAQALAEVRVRVQRELDHQ
jgi:multiple sugar transport system substrate-binding protein